MASSNSLEDVDHRSTIASGHSEDTEHSAKRPTNPFRDISVRDTSITPQQNEGANNGSESDSNSTLSIVDTKEDATWQDVESDVEEFTFKSLLDDKEFQSLHAMLEHCRTLYGLDLKLIVHRLNLDFLETVKLVNYIRSEARKDNRKLKISSKDQFSDDSLLTPVLQDDAVLFSIDDLNAPQTADDETSQIESCISGLKGELRKAQDTISGLQSMARRWVDLQDQGDLQSESRPRPSEELRHDQQEDGYFEAYSYNDIHETMLKDSVRTDAYRDFIYDNKSIFKDKLVLDVGCGTGILSMMCAKAGAKQVFAVDNSDVINKARTNVYENGLADRITCLHGKIEEISLPVPRVDIIVSEWMGYALLYEAMLDSVIYARDRYLLPGGLMVPSHCTLQIAPLSSPDLVADKVIFWRDVYGFRMQTMMEPVYEKAWTLNVKAAELAGISQPFLQLPLHTISTKDLTFRSDQTDPVILKLDHDVEALDGFVIWFDTFFTTSRSIVVPLDAKAETWQQGTAFTTGPGGKTTHWSQVVLFLKHNNKETVPMKAGDNITARVGYLRPTSDPRGLNIEVTWEAMGNDGKRQRESDRQIWHLV